MEISSKTKDVFTEIMTIGAGRASKSLSRLLDYLIVLTIPKIELYLLDELAQKEMLDFQKSNIKVLQEITGELPAKGLVMFPKKSGKLLTQTLMGSIDDSKDDFSPIEVEFFAEVGNMMINAVGSAISDMTGTLIDYTPPEVASKPRISLEGFESNQQACCIAEAKFTIEEIEVEGFIHLLFTYSDVEEIVARTLAETKTDIKFG